MAYAIKRTYGSKGQNHDYLHAWCDQWGTACMGSIKMAMVFASKEDADEAAAKAQRECKGADGRPAEGFTFTAVPANALRTKEFLSAIKPEDKAAILKSIAKHYDRTSQVMLEEVTDAEAEHLLDYMVEPARSIASALMVQHGLRGW
jgi:uncharacterized protein YfcZ (UPF0381/DUF406 family)